jgi:hypothetical protein
MPLDTLGRVLLVAGIGIALIGLFLVVGGRIPYLGNLPGDITIERGGTRFSFPIVTCIVISVVLTIVINLYLRFINRP